MKFNSKEEFAHAIIDAGEDGLVWKHYHVVFDLTRFFFKENVVCGLWNMYNQDWQPYVKPIPDKALVWCWDGRYKSYRGLGVYHVENNRIFDISGQCSGGGGIYENYKQLTEEEIQPWMQELIDNCEE